MGKFDIFNKYNSAVAVIGENEDVVYKNNVFKRVFPDFINLQKFSHKLNYNVCALISNNVEVHSPILQALQSVEDFSAHVLYQSSNNDYFYYDLNFKDKLVIVIGNESKGVKKEIQDLANVKVKIPMLGQTESLNAAVATSIIAYEGVRQKFATQK